jgi:hypothetical protein
MSDPLSIQPLTWIQSIIAIIVANFILTIAKFAVVKVTVGCSVVNFKKYLALQSRLQLSMFLLKFMNCLLKDYSFIIQVCQLLDFKL